MRGLLWPECSDEMHTFEMESYRSRPESRTVLICLDEQGNPGGFAEVSVRPRVDGSMEFRVGYLEGWFVIPEQRSKGIGRRLVQAAERWVREKGCREIASDVDLEAEEALAAHKALGFRETFRLVHLLKKLSE